MFDWVFDKKAFKEFAKLDKFTQRRIIDYLNTHVKNSNNPRSQGKSLKGPIKNYWRYRVGKYRIICDIQDNRCVVLVLKTGKRNDVYQ